MNQISAAALALILCSFVGYVRAQTGAGNVSPEARKAGEERAVNLCSTCHGPRGVSISPEFPILAAQRPGYLVNQINAFRSKTRSEKDAHDFMWGIAGNLDESVIGGIAAYYSAQPPAQGRGGDAALVAQGRELFDKGLPQRGIPACAACHGAKAEGAADFPRLAGQHAKYVVKQINYIQSLVRAAPVMHGIVKDLTPAEIQALAAYVQSL
jgi:cytochrome c553